MFYPLEATKEANPMFFLSCDCVVEKVNSSALNMRGHQVSEHTTVKHSNSYLNVGHISHNMQVGGNWDQWQLNGRELFK